MDLIQTRNVVPFDSSISIGIRPTWGYNQQQLLYIWVDSFQTWEKMQTCETSSQTILTGNVDILDQKDK